MQSFLLLVSNLDKKDDETNLEMTETLTNGYSSERTPRELSKCLDGF